MRFAPATSFAPSKRPTALNPNSWVSLSGSGRVQAVWADKKSGRTLIRHGEVLFYWNNWMHEENPELQKSSLTLEEALALPRADLRYITDASWDGELLWTKGTWNPHDATEMKTMLAGLWEQKDHRPLPLDPAWLGWYNLVDSFNYPMG